MGKASLSTLPYSHSCMRKFLLIPSISRSNFLVTDGTQHDVEFSLFSSDGSWALSARFLPNCDKASRDYRCTIARTFTITTCATPEKKRYKGQDKHEREWHDEYVSSRLGLYSLADIILTFLFHTTILEIRRYDLSSGTDSTTAISTASKYIISTLFFLFVWIWNYIYVSLLNKTNRQSYALSLCCYSNLYFILFKKNIYEREYIL